MLDPGPNIGAAQRQLQQRQPAGDAANGRDKLPDRAPPLPVDVAHVVLGDRADRPKSVRRVQHPLQVSPPC